MSLARFFADIAQEYQSAAEYYQNEARKLRQELHETRLKLINTDAQRHQLRNTLQLCIIRTKRDDQSFAEYLQQVVDMGAPGYHYTYTARDVVCDPSPDDGSTRPSNCTPLLPQKRTDEGTPF